jgi:hypothetical protein
VENRVHRVEGQSGTLILMRDTTPRAEQVRRTAIRRLEPAERLHQAFAFSESVRQLALAGLRERYPAHTTLELVEILLGESLVPDGSRPPHP